MKRRDALKVLGGAAAGLSVADKFGGYFSRYAYAEEKPAFHKEILSAPGGKRAVIIGGGFLGCILCKYLEGACP